MKIGNLVQWEGPPSYTRDGRFPCVRTGIVVKIREASYNYGAYILVDFNPQWGVKRWFCPRELKIL